MEEPSGKMAAPPNPAIDCDAIASAVAWTCIQSEGHIDSENGVETSNCSQIFSVSAASSSSLRFGVEGSEMPTQTRRVTGVCESTVYVAVNGHPIVPSEFGRSLIGNDAGPCTVVKGVDVNDAMPKSTTKDVPQETANHAV